MITDIAYWNRWEEELQRQTPVNVEQNFRVMDAMYQEARELGLIPLSNPLEGLEAVILYAKAINVPRPPRKPV
ncbi:MAG TPA: hypothetical protein VGR89_16300 [Puia sp.]|nr:hypothetical protein [Puia sp.]